jgi:hypothetical protein
MNSENYSLSLKIDISILKIDISSLNFLRKLKNIIWSQIWYLNSKLIFFSLKISISILNF